MNFVQKTRLPELTEGENPSSYVRLKLIQTDERSHENCHIKNGFKNWQWNFTILLLVVSSQYQSDGWHGFTAIIRCSMAVMCKMDINDTHLKNKM